MLSDQGEMLLLDSVNLKKDPILSATFSPVSEPMHFLEKKKLSQGFLGGCRVIIIIMYCTAYPIKANPGDLLSQMHFLDLFPTKFIIAKST